mgnify:CR=1 FL=1
MELTLLFLFQILGICLFEVKIFQTTESFYYWFRHKIIGLWSDKKALSNNFGPDYPKVNVLDNDKLNQALEGVEVVFHLAAKIRVEEGEREPELYKKVNIEGTLNLINKCTEKNIKKLVFASTAAVYGDPEDYPVNEKSKVNPVNVYGATKLEIDQYLEKNAKSLGISSICFRFFQ